jgi:hypothetical protein
MKAMMMMMRARESHLSGSETGLKSHKDEIIDRTEQQRQRVDFVLASNFSKNTEKEPNSSCVFFLVRLQTALFEKGSGERERFFLITNCAQSFPYTSGFHSFSI